jgi:tripartite-type tricarboxylate transporter receptor subunit TctC
MVPFKSGGEIIPALLGGHIHVGANSGEHLPLVKAGNLRLLANFTPQRVKEFPDVPTLRELGFDFVTFCIFGVLGPKGLPEPIAQKLVEVFTKGKKTTAWQETLKTMSLVPVDASGKDFEQIMIAHYGKIANLIKR